jgi:hypothetical protein
LEELPIPETLPQFGAVLAFDTGFWVSEWFETEIEGQDQLRPETNWRVVEMRTSEIEVSLLALPAGVFPIQVLSDRRALVRLEDISGLHGLGIATLRRAPDG